jgi:predicted DNA-binding transcriptional regulator YafY
MHDRPPPLCAVVPTLEVRMPGYRKPSFPAATRFAQLVHGLHQRPLGWSFEAIQDELGISERTLFRYIAACREGFVTDRDEPLLTIVPRGPKRLVRLADYPELPDAPAFDVVLLYLGLSVLRFLDGTVLKEGPERLWRELYRRLSGIKRFRLTDFDRKFYAIPFAMKDYEACSETLDVIVQSLVYQYRIRIDYAGVSGDGKVHPFDPYTLAMYRGGLYLIGYSHRIRKIIYLAVERIREARKLPEKFDYPKGYSPERYTEGVFGIIEGPPTRVKLLLLNEETATFVCARRLHPTQTFQKRRDGTTLVTMTVRGTTELVSWILSLSPWVKVLQPRSLREEVARRLESASRLYRGRTRGGP